MDALDRLHGTWVPGAHLDGQRDLNFALPPQPSLSEKITASRIRHFVDIFNTRPRFRTKTFPERLAFAVLFPLSWVVLGFAAWEILRNHEEQHGAVPWLSTARSLARHLPISSVSQTRSVIRCAYAHPGYIASAGRAEICRQLSDYHLYIATRC
jgi:hypothetical protein